MTDQLAQLKDWSDEDEDIRHVCNVIVSMNDCTSLAMLMDTKPEEFDELFEMCRDMAALDYQ